MTEHVRMFKRIFITACLFALLLTTTTHAGSGVTQRGFKDRKRLGGASQSETKKKQTPEQIRAVNAARSELLASQKQQNAVLVKLKAEFMKSSEWVAAQESLQKTRSDYDAARQPIIEQVHASATYKSALVARREAQTQKDLLNADKKATPEAKAVASKKFLDASARLTKLESDALNADEPFVAARDAVRSAQKTIDELDSKFDADLPNHPEYIAAKESVEQAREKLIAAEKA